MTAAPAPNAVHAKEPPSDKQLHEKYRDVFARIAEGAVERENSRTLPFEQIRWLAETGFSAMRVPPTFGGDGASLPQLFQLLVELAAADPHVAQALRGHFAFVEDRLYASDSDDRSQWLTRFGRGELVGNAVTEIGNVALGDTTTRVTKTIEGWTITGRKYYTTGSIFADWIDASALNPDGVEVAALVPTASERVTVTDDWAGFGQRLSGSGTAIFDAVPVETGHVYIFRDRFPYQTSFYQLVLVTVLAGITQAASDDAARQIASRTHAFSHGNTSQTRKDPQILEIAGHIAADAFAAQAVVVSAAHTLQRAFDAREKDTATQAHVKREAELASAKAQIVASGLAVNASSRVFDALAASATASQTALDRHWRNARTVASHNPVAFKARIVGDALVNGAEPPYEWAVGTTAKNTGTAGSGATTGSAASTPSGGSR